MQAKRKLNLKINANFSCTQKQRCQRRRRRRSRRHCFCHFRCSACWLHHIFLLFLKASRVYLALEFAVRRFDFSIEATLCHDRKVEKLVWPPLKAESLLLICVGMRASIRQSLMADCCSETGLFLLLFSTLFFVKSCLPFAVSHTSSLALRFYCRVLKLSKWLRRQWAWRGARAHLADQWRRQRQKQTTASFIKTHWPRRIVSCPAPATPLPSSLQPFNPPTTRSRQSTDPAQPQSGA